MARIVILSVPAYGHLNPVLPIAKELVRRGHRVTVFNEASFEAMIRPTGADFVAYPPVIHLEDFSRTLKDGDLVAWLAMIFVATGPLVAFVSAKLRDDKPDLLAFDGIALWGEMLATKLKLRSVSISTCCGKSFPKPAPIRASCKRTAKTCKSATTVAFSPPLTRPRTQALPCVWPRKRG